MPVLPDSDREAGWVKLMSDLSNRRESLALSKVELRGVIDTLDVRIDAFLSGLNIPPITNLTSLSAKQQLEIVLNDIRRRFEVA